MDNILELEKSLFKVEYMTNIEYLNNILDDNYLECGKSGKFFNKEDVIRDLSVINEDRKITIYNYEIQDLGTIYLVHYITLSGDNQVYRTSIWNKNNKILFHQASILTEKQQLIEF